MLKDSDLIALSDGRVNTPSAPLGQHVGAAGRGDVPPLWEGDQRRFYCSTFVAMSFTATLKMSHFFFVRAVSNMGCATEKDFCMAC